MNSLIKFFTSLFLCFAPLIVFGQSAAQNKDKESIALLIDTLFDGMREGDSSKVASVFHSDVTMYTSYTDKEGEKKISKGELKTFLKAVGTPHDNIWDEKIWNTKILIDSGIAQVWTDYSFYVGESFSHCGVDAFNLIRDQNKGWLIVSLMDTRRKDNCQSEEK